jgi:hypothetical protein
VVLGDSLEERECRLLWEDADASRFLKGGEYCRCCRDSREKPKARGRAGALAERHAAAIAQGVEFTRSMGLLMSILPTLYLTINQ